MIKAIIFLVLVFGLGFVGFRYLVSGSPRDLGITFTEADRQNAYTKNAVESSKISNTPDVKNSIRYEGTKNIDTTFTSPEITALINSVNWAYYPVSNVQIKINADGTGEVSGVLDVKKVISWVSFTHPTAEIEKAMRDYRIGWNTPFYLKGKASVVDNKVTLSSDKIEVGRVTIPNNLVVENIPIMQSFAEDRINAVPNLDIKSFNLDGGQINFKATVPEKEFTVQN